MESKDVPHRPGVQVRTGSKVSCQGASAYSLAGSSEDLAFDLAAVMRLCGSPGSHSLGVGLERHAEERHGPAHDPRIGAALRTHLQYRDLRFDPGAIHERNPKARRALHFK